jgi:signal transduction histidine kinase
MKVSNSTEGSGLGLAIAKKIVEDHGGEIYLDGSNKTGTLFKIMIPFGIPEGAPSSVSRRPKAARL